MKKKISDKLNELLTNELNIRADIVPMIDEGDEDVLMRADDLPSVLPVLPLLDQVLFPGVLIPIAAQRQKSRQLLNDMKAQGGAIAVFPQRNDGADNPGLDDLYETGVVARVLKVFEIREDTTVAVLQGVIRCSNLTLTSTDPYLCGMVNYIPEESTGLTSAVFKRRVKLLRTSFNEVMKSRRHDDEVSSMLSNIGSDKIFINFAATHLDVDMTQKYALLACNSYRERVNMMIEQLAAMKSVNDLQREIDDKTRHVIENQQREMYLRNQLNVIQEELGGNNGGNPWTDSEIAELRKKAESKDWNDNVKAAFERELVKMNRIPPMSSDYTVQLNYLETLVELPWNHMVAERYSISKARRILERDHYGIEKVKQRIIEYLAVLQRQSEKGHQAKAQVLCLVGPPGTGKTSICRSIAEALGRPYRRVALGGLHDEAEIRGHRRTYVGAMPGRIMQEIIKAGASNPVFVLDEIDKVQTNTVNGDPSSALLEVLDPEQNCHFHDNFVGLDYDLSRVLFIATANSLADVQPALLDRMEVIDFSGYVLEEKIEIAKHHLLPRLLKDNVVESRQLRLKDNLIKIIVEEYTREAGVRQLEKQMAKLVRHRVVLMATGEHTTACMKEDEMRSVLGLPVHNSERARRESREGVVTGLAWTPVGGEILFIEASLSKGKGTLTMTGNLGDVMKESATLAFEYLKANCERFDVTQKQIDSSNIHIHVPEGATPKDGPSAGITMFVAMVSAFTHTKVRPDVAMTGEITLRGAVTPVGGIKEKILAAKRAGIKKLILCEENRRDVEDIEPRYLEGLKFTYINEMSEALPLALVASSKPKKS